MPGLPRDSPPLHHSSTSRNSTTTPRNPTRPCAQGPRASMASVSRGLGTSRGTGATRRGSVLIRRPAVSSGTDVIRGTMPTRGMPATRGSSLSRGPTIVPRGGAAARGPSRVPLGACAVTRGPSAVPRGPSTTRGPMASHGPSSVARGPSVPYGPRVTPRGGTVTRGSALARGASTVPRGPTTPRGPGRLARGPTTPRGPRVVPRGVTVPRGPSVPQGTALSGSIQQALIEKFWVALMVYDTTTVTADDGATADCESESESDSSDSESESDSSSSCDSEVSWDDAEGSCALTNRRDLFSAVLGKKRVRFAKEAEVISEVEEDEEDRDEREEEDENTEKENEKKEHEDIKNNKKEEEKEMDKSVSENTGNLKREEWEKEKLKNPGVKALPKEEEKRVKEETAIEKYEKVVQGEEKQVNDERKPLETEVQEAMKKKKTSMMNQRKTEENEMKETGQKETTLDENKVGTKAEPEKNKDGTEEIEGAQQKTVEAEMKEEELRKEEDKKEMRKEEDKKEEDMRKEEDEKEEDMRKEEDEKEAEIREEDEKEGTAGGVDDTCLEKCLKTAILEVVGELPEGWLLVRENIGELVSSVASLVEVQPRPQSALATALSALISTHLRRPCDKGAITVLHNAHLLLYVALKLACTGPPPPPSPDSLTHPRLQKLIVKALQEVLTCEGSFDRLMVVVLLGGAAPGRGCGWHYETEEESEKIRDLRFILDYIRLLPQCKVHEVVSAPLWWCGSSPVVVAALADSPGLLLTLLQYGAGGSHLHHYQYSKCCTNGVYLAITYLVRRLEGQLCPPFSLDPPQDPPQLQPRDPQQDEPTQGQPQDKPQDTPHGAPRDLLTKAGHSNTAICLRYLLRAVPRVPAKMLRDQLMSNDPPTLLPRQCCLDPPSLSHLAKVATRDLLRSKDLLPNVVATLPVPQTLRDYLNLLKD